MPLVEFREVSLSYDGLRAALDRVSFSIEPGQIFALVGPNGAGKTSLLRILGTLQDPSSGSVTVDGLHHLLDREEVRRRVGYLPDHFSLYDAMTPVDCLEFFGRCYGLGGNKLAERIDVLLSEMGLQEKRNSRVGALSRGMRQRLGLCKALVHSPKLLLLDEPASALDPGARNRLRQTLQQLRDQGLGIIISSHILPDLAGLADAVGIMESGRMVRCESLSGLQQNAYLLRVLDGDRARRVLAEFAGRLQVRAQRTGEFELECAAEVLADLIESLALRGARPIHIAPTETLIESVYHASAAAQVA